MLILPGNIILEKCTCCGLPEHMMVKPTKKPLRYHVYCPYCRFAAFLSKAYTELFINKSQKIKKHNFNEHNTHLFDIEKYDFSPITCMFCWRDLKVKKCNRKRNKVLSIGCKDCSTRFFIPAEYFDIFYVM